MRKRSKSQTKGRDFMPSATRLTACVGALLAVGLTAGPTRSSAQQTIAPTSATSSPIPDVLARYAPVTAERLRKPEDQNWLLFRRTYDGWGYSPLAQITPANIGRLQLAWSFATGQVEGHQAPPIVNNGVMFVATPGNQLIAIEAKSGSVLWRYKRALPDDLLTLHPTNRGVGLFGDKIYFASADAVLVALDARTGKEVWTAKVAEYRNGYYMSLMPLVADGKVMLGTSGGELGVRGFVAAYDADTGKEVWRTYTVPEPGQPGSETWPKGDQWKTGGGSIWVPGTYDTEANIAYLGTGNGGPWMGDQRPGDNLYTSSVLALDVRTGEIKGHFQYHQNDSWDWDEVSPPLIVDYRRGDRMVKGLVDVARDGYLWQLERGPDRIGFVAAQPFVSHNVFKGVEPGTGRPIVDPAHKPATGKTVTFCPSLWGGKDWPPAAFSPKTRLLYIPANENLCTELTAEVPKYMPGERYTGVTKSVLLTVAGADHIGELQAWDLDSGKRAWTTKLPSQNWGPFSRPAATFCSRAVPMTACFVRSMPRPALFSGSIRPSGVNGVPVSFEVDGTQYVAVQSGWGVDAARMQRGLDLLFPGKYSEVPQGGAIYVFAVK
jgi:alcohol dehydrogenase (cytochrome c)